MSLNHDSSACPNQNIGPTNHVSPASSDHSDDHGSHKSYQPSSPSRCHSIPPDDELGPRIIVQLKGAPYQAQLEYIYDEPFEFVLRLPECLFNAHSIAARLDRIPAAVNTKNRKFTQLPISAPNVYCMPKSPDAWKELATRVYDWLKMTASQKSTDEWRWGVNLFWIAYCGYNTGFPFTPAEPNSTWDPDVIPVAGEYIYQKLTANAFGYRVSPEYDFERFHTWQDWFELRRKWEVKGVIVNEFELRISNVGV